MGEVELDIKHDRILIYSHIITYGNLATEEITAMICNEIQSMWNEAKGTVLIKNKGLFVQFSITGAVEKDISELDVLQNTNPRNNYFRIEDFVHGNISFVDGIGSNSGYFLIENLYAGSTTAAHEYGHTLGLVHPTNLDIRGQGIPGIMYPRGTIVDAPYQYNSSTPAGMTGGTMHPKFRKVRQEDIDLLKLEKLSFVKNKAIIGSFTNIYHFLHPRQSGII